MQQVFTIFISVHQSFIFGQFIFGQLRRCKDFKAEICRKLRTKNMPFYIIENYFHFFVISSVQRNKFYVLFAPALGGGIFLKQD